MRKSRVAALWWMAIGGVVFSIPARAQESLTIQVISLTPSTHQQLAKAISEAGTLDSLAVPAQAILLSALRGFDSACRTAMQNEGRDRGTPWPTWHSLGRIGSGTHSWFVGALSCTDTMCSSSSDVALHDRLALLHLGKDRSRLYVFPRDTPPLDEPWIARVDSISTFASDHGTLLQARRVVTSDHPCWGGPDGYTNKEANFILLRGDSVVQAFRLLAEADSVNGDDVDGDAGTSIRSSLRASPEDIELKRSIEEWHESPDGDPKKRQSKIRSEVVRLRYGAKAGRFLLPKTRR